MQIGIIGYPYSGKTTLFQTISQIHIDPNIASKKDSNQAVVKVPDTRLDKLTDMFNPKKKVNATIEFVDFAGFQNVEQKGGIFNTAFLVKARTMDAIVHVVRGFADDTVPHVLNTVNLERDVQNLEDEFVLADLAFVETRIEKLEKDLQKQKNKDEVEKELSEMIRWKETLEGNVPLREIEFDDNVKKFLKNYQPLSAKPLMVALNLDENDVPNKDKIVQRISEKFTSKKILTVPFFAKIELELSQLEEEEKEIFMADYGLEGSPLNRLIQSAYNLLGLQSFFTVGEDETRSWTIRKGMTAQESAGVIHTDFFNKFIRAEVIGYDHFIEEGSFAKCKEKGYFRLEGKEYIVNDGDILNIRHS
ncbi:MAG: redox-regulated ATPase YchF [Ignavibacteria bacterium GWF2_33_9]|nr:MAG: redox-regulated ATPase YchF [Ignavibacteria bacterium GWF2_33_9]